MPTVAVVPEDVRLFACPYSRTLLASTFDIAGSVKYHAGHTSGVSYGLSRSDLSLPTASL